MFSMIGNIFRNLVSRPATRRYPHETRPAPKGSRGRLEMDPETCIYCGICARRCPANAISVGKKPQQSWTFDPYRCIICGYCVDACPKKCLAMNSEYNG